MNANSSHVRIFLIYFSIFLSFQGCYTFRVLNTNNDPATEYESKVMWSYVWGIWDNPKDFVVPNCDNDNAIDEVTISNNFGFTLLTVVTLGFLSPVKVKWKCHKPCPRDEEN